MGSGRIFWHALFIEFRLRFIQFILNYILPHVIHTAFAIYHLTAHTASSSSPTDASLCTCPCDSVWAKGGPVFCRLPCRLFSFCDSCFFTRKKRGAPGPPGPSPRSASGLYQASYIETDSFVKILIKPAVCSCSRFLRHYYQRIIRGLVL